MSDPGKLSSSDGEVYINTDGQEISYDIHTDEQQVDYPDE